MYRGYNLKVKLMVGLALLVALLLIGGCSEPAGGDPGEADPGETDPGEEALPEEEAPP